MREALVSRTEPSGRNSGVATHLTHAQGGSVHPLAKWALESGEWTVPSLASEPWASPVGNGRGQGSVVFTRFGFQA